MRWDEMGKVGWDGMGNDGIGWDRIGRKGRGWNVKEWDGLGWDGKGRKGWQGMG